MKRLRPFWFLVVLAPSLLAQTVSISNRVMEERYALITVTKYCRAIESFSSSHQPRLFAEIDSRLGEPSDWVEYSGKGEWERAGKPKPLALVWYRNDEVVRVVIASKDSSDHGQPYAEYCYRADGGIARIRSVPEVRQDCDKSHFRCHLTFAAEGLYLPHGKAIKEPSEAIQSSLLAGLANSGATDRDLGDLDWRPFKSEETSVSFAEYPHEYLTIWDLPFNQLLYASTK